MQIGQNGFEITSASTVAEQAGLLLLGAEIPPAQVLSLSYLHENLVCPI